MTEDDRDAVDRMLGAHGTATLATSGGGGPWAAAVFYAHDADLNLYFVSDARTRHARDIAEEPTVAAAIHADCSDWSEVRGLQLSGYVQTLSGAEREAALHCYLGKFKQVKALCQAPRGDEERLIAARLQAASLYRLRPVWIRLIDNRDGFGHKRELTL
jgi:uncharacterized protein YhbP (UPF0306 family)